MLHFMRNADEEWELHEYIR